MVNSYLIDGNYNIEHYGYFAYRTITNVAHVSSASQELAEGLFLVLPLQNNTLRGKCWSWDIVDHLEWIKKIFCLIKVFIDWLVKKIRN